MAGTPLLLVVRRRAPAAPDACTVAVVNCDACALAYHAAEAQPPKIKFQTVLELREVRLGNDGRSSSWADACVASVAAESSAPAVGTPPPLRAPHPR